MDAKLAEIVREQGEKDMVGRQAAAEPLPGPAREAFAVNGDIMVGDYRVRRFVDRDFEFLSALKHPLYLMMTSGMKGEEAPPDQYIPRGPAAWELCWIMTRPCAEVKKFIKANGLDGLKEAADAEFGEKTLAELTKLSEAVIHQMGVYWAPVLKYGPSENKAEGEQSSNPPSR